MNNFGSLNGNYKNRELLIIVHGSKEWANLYYDFSCDILQNNYDTYLYNLPSHGSRFSEKDSYFINNYQQIFNELKMICEFYNNKYESISIFGHSLGALVAANFTNIHSGCVNKLVLCGATYPSNRLKYSSGELLARAIMQIKGPKAESKKTEDLIFKGFKTKMQKKNNTSNWLTSLQIEDPLFDKYMRQPFKISYQYTAVKLDNMMRKLDFDNETLLITGENDPVSNFTKDIDKLQKKIKNNKRIDYPNSRHELIFDVDCVQVTKDIIEFLNEGIK